MATASDIIRKSAARAFRLMSERVPATFVLQGVEVVGILETRSGRPIPSQSGIEDGFSGVARLPWYSYDKAANSYSEPFAGISIEDIAQDRIVCNGVELLVVNAAIDGIGAVLTLKLGGVFDA